jgi:hypothetical protein
MPTTIRQADFVDRNNFADFLNRRGLTGSAAEVGVHRGAFSEIFLDNWRGREMFLVDPWSIPEGYEEQAKLLSHYDGDRNKDLAHCLRLLKKHSDRTRYVRRRSLEASLQLTAERLKLGLDPDNFLDFVYIDGDHRREEVEKDLSHWWQKVKPGGILAGHDVLSSEPYNAYEEVQPAVLGFAARQGLDVYLVIEIQFQPWSFFIEKPK